MSHFCWSCQYITVVFLTLPVEVRCQWETDAGLSSLICVSHRSPSLPRVGAHLEQFSWLDVRADMPLLCRQSHRSSDKPGVRSWVNPRPVPWKHRGRYRFECILNNSCPCIIPYCFIQWSSVKPCVVCFTFNLLFRSMYQHFFCLFWFFKIPLLLFLADAPLPICFFSWRTVVRSHWGPAVIWRWLKDVLIYKPQPVVFLPSYLSSVYLTQYYSCIENIIWFFFFFNLHTTSKWSKRTRSIKNNMYTH